MPTSTFFRLPEEKRQRLTEAAWEEFTSVNFASASINRIIQEARIPRGSFYQYFADKEELFRYLLGDMRKYFQGVLQEILEQIGGDLFSLPVAAFDRFINRSGSTHPTLRRCIQVMKLNKSMDLQWLMDDRRCFLNEVARSRIQSAQLREQGEEYVNNVFFLVVAALAVAIMETLDRPEEREEQRRLLQGRIQIIKYGSAMEEKGGIPC